MSQTSTQSRMTGTRILYRDGVPVATLVAGEASFLQKLEPAAEWAAKKLLLRDTTIQKEIVS